MKFRNMGRTGKKKNENKSYVYLRRKQIKTYLNPQKLEQVDIFEYLRVIMERKDSMKKEINDRINSAPRLYHCLNKRFLLGKYK